MIRRMIALGIGGLLVIVAVIGVVLWFTFRVYVPPDKCAVLTRKTGKALPPDQIVATEPGQKGIQEAVLGPGRHFRNPYVWGHEIVDLTVIPAGNPATWEWIHSLDKRRREQVRAGDFSFKGDFPKIGVISRKAGKMHPEGKEIVKRDSGYQGILEEVLTPGVYKINPYIYKVEIHPAVVIPAGFVGVVRNQSAGESAELPEPAVATQPPATRPGTELTDYSRPLAEAGQRGVVRDVLQPGVYFINPWLQKVTLIEIGFNEYSQLKISENENLRITFPSDTGYLIRVGVTVVWGIDPQHAAEIINEFGNIDQVLEKVIGPQLRSICRNKGSMFSARDFIQGAARERFQGELTEELQTICRSKNIEVLLALIREVEVHAPAATDAKAEVTEDLKRAIQRSFIAVESQLTKEKQREAATVLAELEEVRKEVDIAREQIAGETRVMVANVQAEGEKKAAEIDAQAALEVAVIQQEVAKLEAKRTEILGQARADVEQMKNEAEAKGYKMLVDAFGSPRAYNLYTFAEHFQPESIQLFFAGDGTFWTDLSRFQDIGAAKLLSAGSPEKPKPPTPK